MSMWILTQNIENYFFTIDRLLWHWDEYKDLIRIQIKNCIKDYYENREYNYKENFHFERIIQNYCRKIWESHVKIKKEVLWNKFLKNKKQYHVFIDKEFNSKDEVKEYIKNFIKTNSKERPDSKSEIYYNIQLMCRNYGFKTWELLDEIYWKMIRSRFWLSKNKTKKENYEALDKYLIDNDILWNSQNKDYRTLVQNLRNLWLSITDYKRSRIKNKKTDKRVLSRFDTTKSSVLILFKERIGTENAENVFNEIVNFLNSERKKWKQIFWKWWIMSSSSNLYVRILTRLHKSWIKTERLKNYFNDLEKKDLLKKVSNSNVSTKNKVKKADIDKKQIKINKEVKEIKEVENHNNKNIEINEQINELELRKEIASLELETQKIKYKNLLLELKLQSKKWITQEDSKSISDMKTILELLKEESSKENNEKENITKNTLISYWTTRI